MADEAAPRNQRAMAFGALLLLGASAALAPHPVLWIRAAPPFASLLLAVFGLLRPGPGAAVAVMGAAVSVIAVTGVAWQLTMALALVAFFVVSLARPGLGSLSVPVGRVPLWETVACAAVTPVALIAWFVLFRPDVTNITAGIPKVGPVIAILGGLAFAVINATGEELIWRGVIQTRLSTFMAPREAIFLQALSFGAQHAHGFPRGVIGVALAGTWAIGLGLLRKKADGLLASILAHIVADAIIAAIVISTMQ